MYSSVETIALILSIATLVKLIFIVTNGKFFLKFVKPIYKNDSIFSIILLIIAGILLYFLMQTLTIVEIFAVTLFSAMLVGAALVSYGEDYYKIAQKVLSKKSLPWTLWLQVIIWASLSVWVIYIILFQ